ncbi:hypothetical protein BGX27_006412 [Mortierella sp. AM989]|nr:hypothetical protein BGX27_006412 [Mortierella sp. AM989]
MTSRTTGSAMLPPSTPASATTTPTAAPAAPIVEISDSLDPLSHLSHIFEKIRKQVIEWGEDANWKIDVFLLPNEDGTTTTAGASTQDTTPPGSALSSALMAPSSRIVLPGSPQRQVIDLDSDIGTVSPRFALQPPPIDLPSFAGEGIPPTLKEQDVEEMSEKEAKQMLSLAINQVRGLQESLSQVIQDSESMQRATAKKELDLEARMDVEKRIMERDAAILSKKWKDAAHTLREKEREIRDVQTQLEQGKQYIRDRNEERRKRIAEGVMPTPPAIEGLNLGPSTGADLSPQQHVHRPRHVHNHRHHHRYLFRHPEVSNDSLENLALLATQVLMREPLVISKRPLVKNESSENIPLGIEYTPRSDKKRKATDDRDHGLQLRPVKRIDVNGTEFEEPKKVEISPIRSKSLSNGKAAPEVVGRRTQRTTPIHQLPVYQSGSSSYSTPSKTSTTVAKDATAKPKA